MKLTELDKHKIGNVQKALRENYNVSVDFKKLPLQTSQSMLTRVRNLIKEAKESKEFYSKQTSPTYMKLVFMEQALSQHLADLKRAPRPRIVIENEEVEKSQVVLAAQDMVDSVQKMIEEVSDMLVKELPALVDSIQSEIGVNESEQFNSQAAEALTSLQAALTSSQGTLKSALGTITGQGGTEEFQPDMGTPDDEMLPPDDMAGDDEMDIDVSGEEEIEEPEPMPVGGVGRARR
jgi:uncharacterized NAD(P)/FAD-binding protein YdhS